MWRIAAPLILSMASYTIMQFVDRVFLSRYSSVAIQAALPAGALAHTLVCFFQALAGYAGTFTAQYFGARDQEQCVRSTAQGLWLALASWPVIILLTPLGLWLMKLSAPSPEVYQAECTYYLILMLGGVAVPLNSAIGGYFIGIGRTQVNMIANFLGCSLNVALNYAMIFGHWGFPEMGIAGAAYATLTSTMVTILIQYAIFLKQPKTRKLGWRNAMRLEIPLLRRIIYYGTPSGFHLLMDIGAFAAFIMFTGKLGGLALAASNIAFSINNLAFAPLLGFGMAAATLVGQKQGANNPEGAMRAGYTALKMGLLYMFIIGSSFVLFPTAYFEIFKPANASFNTVDLVALGRTMLLLMAIWGLLDTVSIVLGGALKGAGDVRFVMAYMIISGWFIMVPGCLILLWLGYSIIALWIWLAIYVFILAIGLGWRWHSGAWQKIDLIERKKGLDYIPPITDEIF